MNIQWIKRCFKTFIDYQGREQNLTDKKVSYMDKKVFYADKKVSYMDKKVFLSSSNHCISAFESTLQLLQPLQLYTASINNKKFKLKMLKKEQGGLRPNYQENLRYATIFLFLYIGFASSYSEKLFQSLFFFSKTLLRSVLPIAYRL